MNGDYIMYLQKAHGWQEEKQSGPPATLQLHEMPAS